MRSLINEIVGNVCSDREYPNEDIARDLDLTLFSHSSLENTAPFLDESAFGSRLGV